MKILVLTFYYQPDLCAGSFRATPLVERLNQEMGADDRLEVITTMPNRYQSFAVEAPAEETHGSLRVRRIPLPAHASGMRDQARAFAAYARATLRMIRGEKYDLVIATSSRLFTAVLGSRVAKKTGAKLYLDMRDIFTETISDVLRGPLSKILLPGLEYLERSAIRRAERVNLVSEGFRPYFERVDPSKEYRFFTNGIDGEFLNGSFNSNEDRPYRKIVYAGNIGEGQGLHRIVPGLARRLGSDYRIVVVGDGGARHKLEKALQEEGVDNVDLHPPVERATLRDIYADADCLFLHLNDLPAFKRVLPSKIFEFAATGKPVLAGVSGYSAEFLRAHVSNAAVFDPCDVNGGVEAVESLRFQHTDRRSFVSRFRRSRIINDLVEDIMELTPRYEQRSIAA